MRIYILFLLSLCALKYFNQGDYAAVHVVLEDVERETELQRAQMRAEAAKNEIQGYVEAEAAYQKALEIRTRLAARNPDAYEPNFAKTLWNQARLYATEGMKEKELDTLRTAQALFEKLAQKKPNYYGRYAEYIRRTLEPK